MKIFTKEYRKLLIGIVSLIFVLFVKWWLAIIPLICLVFLKPPTENDLGTVPNYKEYQRNCFYVVLCIPVLALMLNIMGNRADALQAEKKRKEQIVLMQQEQERIDNALVWNIDDDPSLNDNEKTFVKAAAQNLINNEKKCVKLRMGGKSTSKDGQYYLQCLTPGDEYFNVYFTPEDIEDDKTLKTPEPYEDAFHVCLERIQKSVNYSSTIDMHFFDTDEKVYADGDTRILQVFSAKNAFGVEQNFKADCLISPDGSIQFELIER